MLEKWYLNIQTSPIPGKTRYNKVHSTQLSDTPSDRLNPFWFCVTVCKDTFKMAYNICSIHNQTSE